MPDRPHSQSDDVADSLRSLREGDAADESALLPRVAPVKASEVGLSDGAGDRDFNDESGFRPDHDIPVSKALYASQPMAGQSADHSMFRERRAQRVSHTRRMVVVLLFLFGVVVALPGVWGILVLLGKTEILADRPEAVAMAWLACVGGFSIALVMWESAIFFGLQSGKS